MRVYPAAAPIRPCFSRKALAFRSLRPDLLEIKVGRHADMKEPQTSLTTARSMVTVRATQTQAQVCAPHRAKCIVLDIDSTYPRRTCRVRDLTTGQVTIHQAIIWRPTADAGEEVFRNMVTKGGARHGHYLPRRKKTFHYTSSLGSPETISEEPESGQHDPGGVSGAEGPFALERV
ncbi:unnamed protein product, partial [Ascophyllum nodosum]